MSNKSTINIPEIIIPSLETNSNKLLESYYCPKCFNIPSIKFESNYVLIECTCGTKEDIKIQSNKEDITKPEILLEYAEHKQYKLLVETFNEINSINANKNPKCEIKMKINQQM